jgi:hypothetical protein
MSPRSRLPLAALALTLTLTPQPARAQDELSQASKEVFKEAISAYSKENWAVCRTKAIGVWQQVKSVKVAGVLGMCESELGLNRDAAEHLDFFLQNQPKDAPPDQVAAARARWVWPPS